MIYLCTYMYILFAYRVSGITKWVKTIKIRQTIANKAYAPCCPIFSSTNGKNLTNKNIVPKQEHATTPEVIPFVKHTKIVF